MNKKMICGILFTLAGLVFSAVIFNYLLWHAPEGGSSLLTMDADIGAVFALSLLIMGMGLAGCVLEAIQSDK